jgi:hypothetical protein
MKTIRMHLEYFKNQNFDFLEKELNEKFSKGFYISEKTKKSNQNKVMNDYDIYFEKEQTIQTAYKVVFSDNTILSRTLEYDEKEKAKVQLLKEGYTEACVIDRTSKHVSENLKKNIATVYKVYVYQKSKNL